MAHPAITQAIVTGLKDAHYGEVVGAFLQHGEGEGDGTSPRPDDQQMRDWVRPKLGKHKAPAHIFWLGDDGVPPNVPLTGSGKIQKFKMARLGEELLRTRRLEKL